MGKQIKTHKIYWHKEVFLVVLALASIALLIYEEAAHPTEKVVKIIDTADIAVACIFLLDFVWLYKRSRDKKYFMRHNWYLLLASLPIPFAWADALRGVRVLRFIRLLRAGEHLDFGYKQTKR